MPSQEAKKYCRHCGIKVKKIERQSDKVIGRGTLPSYLHDPRSNERTCGKPNLFGNDVTEKEIW